MASRTLAKALLIIALIAAAAGYGYYASSKARLGSVANNGVADEEKNARPMPAPKNDDERRKRFVAAAKAAGLSNEQLKQFKELRERVGNDRAAFLEGALQIVSDENQREKLFVALNPGRANDMAAAKAALTPAEMQRLREKYLDTLKRRLGGQKPGPGASGPGAAAPGGAPATPPGPTPAP